MLKKQESTKSREKKEAILNNNFKLLHMNESNGDKINNNDYISGTRVMLYIVKVFIKIKVHSGNNG